MRCILTMVVFYAILLFSVASYAVPNLRYEDATAVERSELILIGHLQYGSMKLMSDESTAKARVVREKQFTLVITEILKGKWDEKRIQVIIAKDQSLLPEEPQKNR